MRIAIIGAGISGLTAAYRLHSQHEITLFEANNYLGGHTNTVDVDLVGGEVRFASQSVKVTLADSAKQSLVSGQWDFLGQLLDNKAGIAATAAKVPYLNHFSAS